MSYSVEQITASPSTAFLSDIYNILKNYSGDLFDEVELNQTIEGATIVENNLIFKKDNIDMVKLDMIQTTVASSSNKMYFSSKNSASPLQTGTGWSTANSGKTYVVQTPYCVAIHGATTATSSCSALILSKTQLNTLGIYYRGTSATALSYGFDNIVIDQMSSDQLYSTTNSIMTQMLPTAIITPSSNEYMPNVYAIIKSQGINNAFREVRLGLRNFITDGRIAYEI